MVAPRWKAETEREEVMRAWIIDPLSQPVVRAATFSDDLKTQAIEMLHQLQNYDAPKIARMLTNGDLLLVSEETWIATGWFFRVEGQEYFGRGIICGHPSILRTLFSHQLSQR